MSVGLGALTYLVSKVRNAKRDDFSAQTFMEAVMRAPFGAVPERAGVAEGELLVVGRDQPALAEKDVFPPRADAEACAA